MAEGHRTRMYAGIDVTERQAARREALLNAGLTVIAAGYSEASVKAICVGARLSSRQFYEEFASREELLRVLLRRTVNECWDVYQRAGFAGYMEVLTADPRKARVLLLESVAVSEAVEWERARFAWKWALAEDRDPLRVIAIMGAVDALTLAWATTMPLAPLADALRALDGIIDLPARLDRAG